MSEPKKEENTETVSSVKLTKKGVPRKPYVKTPAREEAFKKCKEAREKKLAEKKVLHNAEIQNIAPKFDRDAFEKGDVKEKQLQIHEIRKAKAKLQAEKIVQAMTERAAQSKQKTDEVKEPEEADEGEEEPMEIAQPQEEPQEQPPTQNEQQPEKPVEEDSHEEADPEDSEHVYDNPEELFTSDSELDPEYGRQVRKFIRREMRKQPSAAPKKKVRVKEAKEVVKKVKKRLIRPKDDEEPLPDHRDYYHDSDTDGEKGDYYRYEPLRVPRQRSPFATFTNTKPRMKKVRTGYTADQLSDLIWL